MKIAPRQVEAFLRAPEPALRAVLVYGPDAGLVRERRCHEHYRAIGKPLGLHDTNAGKQCVIGVHHALWLTSRSGGVADLHDFVRAETPFVQQAGRADLVFPTAIDKCRFEGLFGRAADDKDFFEIGHVSTDVLDHRGIVKTAKGLRDEQCLGVREGQHEGHLALAKDRHQGIGDGPDVHACQMNGEEFPPVWHL